MTLTWKVTLAANADVRANPAGGGEWLRLDGDLWLSPMSEVSETVPDQSGGQAVLAYDFKAAKLGDADLAAFHPEVAARVLARSRAVLEDRLATLSVPPSSRIMNADRFPALKWPRKTTAGASQALRQMQKSRSDALRVFLTAERAFYGESEEGCLTTILRSAEGLTRPAKVSLQASVDLAKAEMTLDFRMEDPGKALPGVGGFVRSNDGYRFQRKAGYAPGDLRQAYAHAIAAYLVTAASRIWRNKVVQLQVSVAVGESQARIDGHAPTTGDGSRMGG